jgi:hypothetical protein
VEALGYGAIWIGGSPPADLFLAQELLDATMRLAVATGSDALIEELAVHGDVATVAAWVTAHLDAGADHVCIQLLTPPDTDPLPGLAALAEALELG